MNHVRKCPAIGRNWDRLALTEFISWRLLPIEDSDPLKKEIVPRSNARENRRGVELLSFCSTSSWSNVLFDYSSDAWISESCYYQHSASTPLLSLTRLWYSKEPHLRATLLQRLTHRGYNSRLQLRKANLIHFFLSDTPSTLQQPEPYPEAQKPWQCLP